MIVLALAGAGAAPAAAQQDGHGCPAALARWAASCDAGDETETVRVAGCPAGHAIFAVGPGRLRIDVTHRPGEAFVAVGPLGASPIGEFSDWAEVPEADRNAFDGLVRCLRAHPEALVAAIAAAPIRPFSGAGTTDPLAAAGSLPTPWRVLLGALVALVVLVRRFGGRTLAVHALPLVTLGTGTLVGRRFFAAEAYFHQNGQGPFWIAHALGEPSSYGPGYAQIFYWVASGADDPDGAVFLLQAVLAALVPGTAFVIARGVGAPRAIAWGAALAIALSPIHARLSQGESYFATCGALLAIAAAFLAICERPKPGSHDHLAGAAAAGLLVAQAALLHPVCWLAAALVPGVVIVGRGPTGARMRQAALATGVIAAVVLVSAGPDMWAVLTGPFGAHWLDPSHGAQGRGLPIPIVLTSVAALAALVLAVRSPPIRRAGLATALLCVVIVVWWHGNLLGVAPPWVHHAYLWLYMGPGLAAVAALLRELGALAAESKDTRWETLARWLGASLILGATLAWHGVFLHQTTPLPTDAREASLVRRWRTELPRGAVVAYLERAGDQIVGLPLYHRRTVRFFADQPPADLTSVGREVFLYRSGLCTTVRGRSYCDAIEATYELEPLETAVLPAVPSMGGLSYDRSRVEVGLYRVRDRRRGPSADESSSAGREGR